MIGIRFRLATAVFCAFSGLGLMWMGTTVLAQPSQPAGGAPALEVPAPPGDAGNFRPNGGGAFDPYAWTDFPVNEVRAVPYARAAAARARGEMDLAQLNLHRWIDSSWDDFENSKEYLDAAGAEKKAYDDYQRERARVLSKLSSDPTYVAMIDLINDLRDKIERDRPRNGRAASSEQVETMLATATVKLGYATTVSSMESAALAADGTVQSSRQKLMEAGSRTREMRSKFGRSVRRDPQFLAHRDNMDQLRIERMVSDHFLDGVINARAIALDYAFYLRRWDQYRYSVSNGWGSWCGPTGSWGWGSNVPFGGPYVRRY